jgi:hypothetical protein
MARDLQPEELAQRVAVLKRFRELLLEQRNRFQDYLAVLDKQKDVIEQGNAERLIAQVEVEEKIVADIFAVQKVIVPLEDMYRTSYPERESEVPKLKAALEELMAEASTRSARNRDLLSKRMEELRTEIRTLRNNPFAPRRSVYDNSGSASLIDIKG